MKISLPPQCFFPIIYQNFPLSNLKLLFVHSFNMRYRGYLFFLVKDRNSFHRVDTIANIFMSGANAPPPKYSDYFMLLTLSGRSFIKIQYSSFPSLPVAYPFQKITRYNIMSSARNVR